MVTLSLDGFFGDASAGLEALEAELEGEVYEPQTGSLMEKYRELKDGTDAQLADQLERYGDAAGSIGGGEEAHELASQLRPNEPDSKEGLAVLK